MPYFRRQPSDTAQFLEEINRFKQTSVEVLDDATYSGWSAQRYLSEKGYSEDFRASYFDPRARAELSMPDRPPGEFPIRPLVSLWRMLGLDTLLNQLMPTGREDVPWPAVAAILTIARLCEPSSELHIQDAWYPNTALDDLLGVCGEQVNVDRLYAGLDRLLPHKAAIEQHLKDRLGVLFGLKYDLLLYDLTSTYFEGQCPSNPMAKRGYSRDHRSDCLQVVIALVVTEQGMPIGYEVFDGNQSDSKTVQQMVVTMEERHGKAQRNVPEARQADVAGHEHEAHGKNE